MSLIEWNDDWLIGHPAIDYDHKMLVTITNQLYDAYCGAPLDQELVRRSLEQLVSYVERHFAREEEVFLSTDYPNKDGHLSMHRQLEGVVRDIAITFDREEGLLDLDEVIDFLKRWLVQHIRKHDFGYRAYLKTEAA